MTFKQILHSDKEMLTPKDVSEVLGCNPYNINVQVKQDLANGVNSLGFPVLKLGCRIKIPRKAFINYILGKEGESDANNS